MHQRARHKKAMAAVLGMGTAASWLSTCDLASVASAAPAPGQDVANDWGQTADEVTAEVTAAVDADARVIAARTRYLRALANYAQLKRDLNTAIRAYRAARLTRSTTDDVTTMARCRLLQSRVFPYASEVVASQLAMVRTVDLVTAQVRSLHYVKAPVVYAPSQPVNVHASGRSNAVLLTWDAVPGATSYRIFRDSLQIGTATLPIFDDTGLTNGTSYGYTVRAINVGGWSPLSIETVGTPSADPPALPTNLVATAGDATVSLTWTASPTATSYTVYRDGSPLASVASPSFADSGLVDGMTYSYTVEAFNGTVTSGQTAPATATPVATAPAAPTGLVGSPGNQAANLSWTAVSNATAYRVYRNGVSVGTTTSPSFGDTGLTNGTAYTYYVVAYRLNSPASSPSSSIVVTPVAPPLSTPSGLAATPGDAQVSLSWTAVPGATSYRVYRGATLVGSPSSASFTDIGLTNGTTYSYTVVAWSATSSSAASAPVTATPAAAAPGAPTGLSGQAGDTTATLSWNAVTGATSYKVYRGGVLRTTVSASTFTDTGLTNGTAYSYYVTAIRNGVESSASSTVSITPVAIVPAVPSGLVASPGDGTVTLTWTASANAQSYRVYRGATVVGSPSSATFTDTGLIDGTTYSYTVVAVNGTAVSAASAAVTATPMAPAPAAPTGLVATPGNATVALSWSPTATATSYRVYRGGVLIASPTGTSYSDSGLTNGTSYSYYVVAVNQTTPGPASATVTATPVKPPVNGTFTGAVTAIANGHGTLKVTIVISNSVITSATGTLLTWDSQETQNINNTAIPQYNTKTVTANSANITKVSGATLTWSAYKTSLQSALTQAGL